MNTGKFLQSVAFLSLLAFGSVASACSDGPVTESRSEEVERILGGGMRGARIEKVLGVVLLDAKTDRPIPAAQIWLGEGDSAKAVGVTDDGGQLRIDQSALKNSLAGKDSVAVTAVKAGYVTTSYVGVDRDNLTIAARPIAPDPDAEATINLALRRFHARPAPAAGEYWIAVATVSKDLGFLDDGLDEARAAPAPTTCRWVNDQTPCILALKGPAGRRTVFAVAAKGKDLGTPGDESDDELEVTGLSSATIDLTLDKPNAVTVDEIADSAVTGLALVPGAASGDLAKVVGVPGINRGGDLMVFPATAAKVTRWVVPLKSGEFATEVLWGVATASSSDGNKRARVLRRGVEAPTEKSATPVDISTPAFLGPVTVLLQNQALMVDAPAETTLHRLKLKRGSEILLEALLIGETQFTPPTSLLTAGPAEAEIASLEAMVDTEKFSLRESYETLTRDAAAQIAVTLP
jgi:hypothetical protein